MSDDVELSIVSPVYLGEGTVGPLVEGLAKALDPLGLTFEIVLVEDCSPDRSWEAIEALAASDPRVRGVRLSRNFGQHAAITAGLDHTRGEWVVVMDCDLQDRPEEIPRLLERAREGHHVVLAQRQNRSDGALKRAGSRAFYLVLQYLSGLEQDPLVANFGIYHRKVIDVLVNDMRENIRFFPMMVRWVGFDVATLEVAHGTSGRPSSYSLGRLLDLAFNVMLTFSDKPLRLTVRLGFLITVFSFLFGVFTIYRMLVGEIEVAGYTSLIVSIWFLSGVIIFVLGMMGLYLAKTFEEVKRRPIYVVQERLNQREDARGV